MKIIIFDLDGTLANIDHRLHFINQQPKNWLSFSKACSADTPKLAVIQAAKALSQLGHPLWILSGRSRVVERETRAWLK
jgi:hydroxymethylpyrimidine pyrophosphatase-like HAD family hydrolase